MIRLDAVRTTLVSSLKKGDMFFVGDKIGIACGEELDRYFFDVATGGVIQLPAVQRVLVIEDPLVSIDPASAIGYDAEAPAGALLITKGGPAVYTLPSETRRLSVYVFLSGEVVEYRRSGEPAFTRWQIGVRQPEAVNAVVVVDVGAGA
ncbi:MAG: hypothetical protein PGN12_05900 [Sphingomonas phyllosphaerae]